MAETPLRQFRLKPVAGEGPASKPAGMAMWAHIPGAEATPVPE